MRTNGTSSPADHEVPRSLPRDQRDCPRDAGVAVVSIWRERIAYKTVVVDLVRRLVHSAPAEWKVARLFLLMLQLISLFPP